jgi:uncharacterized membrane protein YbaN (DUF454 family)
MWRGTIAYVIVVKVLFAKRFAVAANWLLHEGKYKKMIIDLDVHLAQPGYLKTSASLLSNA